MFAINNWRDLVTFIYKMFSSGGFSELVIINHTKAGKIPVSEQFMMLCCAPVLKVSLNILNF